MPAGWAMAMERYAWIPILEFLRRLDFPASNLPEAQRSNKLSRPPPLKLFPDAAFAGFYECQEMGHFSTVRDFCFNPFDGIGDGELFAKQEFEGLS
jgi:hypothetical protein